MVITRPSILVAGNSFFVWLLVNLRTGKTSRTRFFVFMLAQGKEILPTLLKEIPSKYSEQELKADADLPRFTIVFDRVAYSPVFFQEICNKYRIAVITYRKNAINKWNENDFDEHKVYIEGIEPKFSLQKNL